MTEAREGFAVLEDVDADTFVRFTQWAYQGYYLAAGSSIKSASESESAAGENQERGSNSGRVVEPAEEVVDEMPPPTEDDWGQSIENLDWGTLANANGWNPRHSPKKSKKAKNGSSSQGTRTSQVVRENVKEAFINREYNTRQETIRVPPPLPNQDANEDYTEVFLSHARLYVFADMYDIQPLKRLALEELHATLAIFNLYPERTGDVITLLRYVYAYTGEDSVCGKSGRVEDDNIRLMLTLYVGYEMNMLMKDSDFKDLMIEDGGALLADFMGMVEQRIH